MQILGDELAGYEGRATAVGDASGRVHIFIATRAPDAARGEGALWYARGTDGMLDEPYDIFVGPADAPEATCTTDDLVHVFLRGGMHLSASVSAPYPAPAEWTERPEPFSRDPMLDPAVAAVPGGVIHVLYPRLGGAVYHARFGPDGNGWSEPASVSEATSERAANWPGIAVGPDGRLHAVWTDVELPGGWPPLGVYYASSDDRGDTWTEAIELAGAGYDQANVAVGAEGSIHAVWLGAVGTGGRYHSYSTDGGATWSAPYQITAEGATSGIPQLAVDTSGFLHLVTSVGFTRYARWDGASWSALQEVRALASEPTEGPASENPRMAISGGNRLHLVFTEGGRWWYTSRVTGSPPLPTALAAGRGPLRSGAPVTPERARFPELEAGTEGLGRNIPTASLRNRDIPAGGPTSQLPTAAGVLSAGAVVAAAIVAARRRGRP